MPAVDVVIQTKPAETEEIELVPDLEVLSELNRCSCSAGDDQPY